MPTNYFAHSTTHDNSLKLQLELLVEKIHGGVNIKHEAVILINCTVICVNWGRSIWVNLPRV